MMPICLQMLNTDAHWIIKALVFQQCMRCPECLHVHHAVLIKLQADEALP